MNAQLILNWLGEKINLNGAATDDEITDCEKKLNFRFPEDFKEFYRKINGFKDWEMDSEMLSLWPLNRIIEDEDYRNSQFVPFCDFLINSHIIGFSKTDRKIYKNYVSQDLVFLCNNFKDFMQHWQNKTNEYL